METRLPILYTFRRCPYAIRARMAIAYSGVSIVWREVLLSDKPDDLLRLSPKATVPVLQLDNGRIIDESLDIMFWAVSRNDPDCWFEVGAEKRKQIIELIENNDGQFKYDLDRYKYSDRYPENTLEQYRVLGEQFLERLEGNLKLTDYLVGNNQSLADIAIFPFVRQFSGVEPDWFQKADYPKLKIWLKHFLESELFLSVMPKYSQWREGDAPIVFPSPSKAG